MSIWQMADGRGRNRQPITVAGAVGLPVRRRCPPRSGLPRTLPHVWSQRSTVDYALARRAVLTALASGRTSTRDACDAGIYLRRAARYHGEPTGTDCPVCHVDQVVHVTYTYGDCFRADVNGRARATRDLPALAREHDEFRVYVVEVCPACGWNHLVTSYVLGTGRVERPRRRARTGH